MTQAIEIQSALDALAVDIRVALEKYLDATGHSHVPNFDINYAAAHSIGKQTFMPNVKARGELFGEA